jgi:hypothetical protein
MDSGYETYAYFNPSSDQKYQEIHTALKNGTDNKTGPFATIKGRWKWEGHPNGDPDCTVKPLIEIAGDFGKDDSDPCNDVTVKITAIDPKGKWVFPKFG